MGRANRKEGDLKGKIISNVATTIFNTWELDERGHSTDRKQFQTINPKHLALIPLQLKTLRTTQQQPNHGHAEAHYHIVNNALLTVCFNIKGNRTINNVDAKLNPKCASHASLQ